MSYIRIRKHYVHLPYLILGVVEFFLVFASIYIVKNVQQSLGVGGDTDISTSPYLALTYAGLFSAGSMAMGVYMAMMREGFMAMFFRTLVAYCFIGVIAITVLALIWPFYDVGGNNLVWIVLVATCLTLIVRGLFGELFDSEQMVRRVLVVGTGQSARQLQKDYETVKKSLGLRIVGYVGSESQSILAADCLALPEDWVAYCKQHRISEIVVAAQERRKSDGNQFPIDKLLQCKLNGIEVLDAVEFYERELNKVKLDLLQPSWIIFSDGFLLSKSRDLAKRIFDVFISVFLFLVLLPFLLCAACLVYLETGRPILYSQKRVGKNGREFNIYKIRSMRQDAEKDGKAVWAKSKDNRITRVGAFLRNTRVDEIPQLWNVLKGDMSFVGPRPERPEFVQELNENIPFYEQRHIVKPGLMGWAQLNYPYGASVEDAKGKLEYDLYYTKNHSFIMDLLIMIQTVEVVLLGKGVH